MRIRFPNGIKLIILVTVICALCAAPLCAASKKKSSRAGNAVPENTVTGDTGRATAIDVPKKTRRTYFSRIAPDVMAAAENASPDSIRTAVSLLRKSGADYTEPEKVLLNVLSGIMKTAWISERADWETPPVSEATPYLGAIDSAKNGIYDLSTGNVDFFTLVLPSLVVVKADDVSSYAAVAEQALTAALALRPESALAHYLIGVLYAKTRRTEEALAHFSLASKSAPLCKETAYAEADCLKRLGRMQEAQTAALSLLQRYPADISVLKLCAETSFALKDFSAAEEYVGRVLQQEPNDLDYVLFRARILAGRGDYIRAASLLDVYARQDTSSRAYLLLRARLQYEWSKNFAAASETIERALSLYPNDLDVLLFAARLASSTAAPLAGVTAEEFAKRALAIDPANTEAKRYEIDGMMRSGKWKGAYDSSKALLASKDALRNDIFVHIRICLELGKNDEAWNLISPLYAENPDDDDILQSYVVVLSKTGRSAQALSLINSRLPASSSRMKSFFYYRRSFLDASQEDSLADLRSSLIANPRNADALFRLYEIYYGRRDYRKAQYYLKQVVALDPNNAEMRKLNEELTKLIK
ncbi:tetratricopeptide repeat protein [Treponema socranskii]|uniref:tetratricopeptide repeat protein n=1 Tax=Treponema socranskii TaxID=53419 RepID=UPI003D8B17D7